ncbi:MAG: ABC-type transport auxiliary lipoprotein family protein [Betaproteobacteria bacterium]
MTDFRRAFRATAAAAMLVALGLSACSLTRPPPVKAQFLLQPAMPERVTKTQPGALRVGTVNVAGPFRDRSFVVRVSDLRYETDFYDEYVTPPAPMIAEATSRALSRAKVFSHIAAPGTLGQADYVLDGFVSALYADHREQNSCKAVLVISYYLSQADTGSGVPFWSKDYRRDTPCKDDSAEAFAQGLNTGLSEILVTLAKDLASAELPAAQ